jgi:hypothetical protein
MLCELEKGTVNFEQFDPRVLENFGFKSKRQIEILMEKLSSGFGRASKS